MTTAPKVNPSEESKMSIQEKMNLVKLLLGFPFFLFGFIDTDIVCFTLLLFS